MQFQSRWPADGPALANMLSETLHAIPACLVTTVDPGRRGRSGIGGLCPDACDASAPGAASCDAPCGAGTCRTPDGENRDLGRA
jgi:hypothetical protein